MYLRGEYAPWAIEEMVDVLRAVCRIFNDSGIPLIRMGLQPTKELEESIVAGPYHPSLRQIVDKDF
jgi:histone acetyltransferase (RNA polymerase elongator complex component)